MSDAINIALRFHAQGDDGTCSGCARLQLGANHWPCGVVLLARHIERLVAERAARG
jgi:hypothetical protein